MVLIFDSSRGEGWIFLTGLLCLRHIRRLNSRLREHSLIGTRASEVWLGRN